MGVVMCVVMRGPAKIRPPRQPCPCKVADYPCAHDTGKCSGSAGEIGDGARSCYRLRLAQVAWLAGAVFIVSAGYRPLLPALPGWLAWLMPGVSATEVGRHVGFLSGVYAAGVLLGAPLWGVVSDRVGRGRILIIGLVGYVASLLLLLIPAMSRVWGICALRGATGFFRRSGCPGGLGAGCRTQARDTARPAFCVAGRHVAARISVRPDIERSIERSSHRLGRAGGGLRRRLDVPRCQSDLRRHRTRIAGHRLPGRRCVAAQAGGLDGWAGGGVRPRQDAGLGCGRLAFRGTCTAQLRRAGAAAAFEPGHRRLFVLAPCSRVAAAAHVAHHSASCTWPGERDWQFNRRYQLRCRVTDSVAGLPALLVHIQQ